MASRRKLAEAADFDFGDLGQGFVQFKFEPEREGARMRFFCARRDDGNIDQWLAIISTRVMHDASRTLLKSIVVVSQ